MSGAQASVVIAAHDEAGVIGACLDALGTDRSVSLDVIVAANGCHDNTAEIASSYRGVRVIEIEQASKPAALNVADRVSDVFPRIYLDADIVMTPGSVAALVSVLDNPGGPLAAVPARRLDLAGRPPLVRGYFAIHARLPVNMDGLFGRGMIGLSAEGRSRFGTFPIMVADDLFLDSLFSPDERAVVEAAAVTVETPKTTRDLVRRLVRVRRGNAAMRQAARQGRAPASVRAADRWSWLKDVVLPHPWLAPAALVYVAVTVLAAALAKRGGDEMAWGRDESTRQARTPRRVEASEPQ